MSHWGTPDTKVNRTCPLRRVVRVEPSNPGWVAEHMECGHAWPAYAASGRVGRRRRCLVCGGVAPAPAPVAPAPVAPEAAR